MLETEPLTMDADPQAADAGRELLRGAYERTYHFPEGFAGFRAHLEAWRGGGSWSTTATVRSAGDITFDPPIAADGAWGWLKDELAAMVHHRQPGSFEERHGGHGFALAAAEPGTGQRVRLLGDPMSSVFRVRDGSMVEVERTAGPQTFTIYILSKAVAPDGRHVAEDYVVVYRSLEPARMTRCDAYSDRYAVLGPLLLPYSHRVIQHTDEGVDQRGLTLSDHELL